MEHSDAAVDLFFVLSGFVFTHVYWKKGGLVAETGPFFLARIARIYPLHLIMLFASAMLLFTAAPAFTHNVPPDTWHFALNLLMRDVGTCESDALEPGMLDFRDAMGGDIYCEVDCPMTDTPEQPAAKVRVIHKGYVMSLATYVAYALSEGDHWLYTRPLPVADNADVVEAVARALFDDHW